MEQCLSKAESFDSSALRQDSEVACPLYGRGAAAAQNSTAPVFYVGIADEERSSDASGVELLL